ncbi:MAG: hypothetical protein Q8R00_00830 [Candidatus Nanoarchaeia archaeon]|nr:hypothetical protein [Candidatus Nanoarchaeia archaeon]
MRIEPYLDQAEDAFNENFKKTTWFESCIFLTEHPAANNYDYRYMMAAREMVSDPKLAKKSINSMLAEAFLAKKLGWKVEFLTGSLGVYSHVELAEITKKIAEAYGEKINLNFGAFSRSQLDVLKPFVRCIYGSVDTVNMDVRKRISKDKPIGPILTMYDDAYGFEKGMTLTIGVGEKDDDATLLNRFIENNKIDRITFYPLDSGDNKFQGPDSLYYAKWIAQTRITFPKLHINAGISPERAAEVGLLLRAGANSISKFPGIEMFNTEQARVIEEEAKNAGRKFLGTLTDVERLDISTEEPYSDKLNRFIEVMKRSK